MGMSLGALGVVHNTLGQAREAKNVYMQMIFGTLASLLVWVDTLVDIDYYWDLLIFFYKILKTLTLNFPGFRFRSLTKCGKPLGNPKRFR